MIGNVSIMELIYFFIGLDIFAACCGIWVYFDIRRERKREQKRESQ
jgi:hypothetical protein